MAQHFTQWPKATVLVKGRMYTFWAGYDSEGRLTVMQRIGCGDNCITGEWFDDIADAQVWVSRSTNRADLATWLGLVLAR